MIPERSPIDVIRSYCKRNYVPGLGGDKHAGKALEALAVLERRLAQADEALRRISSYPDTWQAEIAREALQAEPATEERPAPTASPFTTAAITEICGPGYGTADEAEA